MRRLIWFSLMVTAPFISGCVNTPPGVAADTTVAIETVHAGSVCSGAPRVAQALWIDSHQDLKRHWQRMLSHRLGAGKPSIPQVEWGTHGIVVVHMGQKTTGGYRLELAKPQGRLQAAGAMVSVNWVEPPAGAIAAQMITSPCLLFKIQRGHYHSVVIVDQSGQERVRADLPE
jgi:predicted small secreted protein